MSLPPCRILYYAFNPNANHKFEVEYFLKVYFDSTNIPYVSECVFVSDANGGTT